MLDVTHGSLELNTVFTEPLYFLEKHFLVNQQNIKEWFAHQWQLTPPPVYGSVDLRNAGFKLAPIDMNLFPAGFNNLNPDFLNIAVTAARKIIHQMDSKIKRILIVPESHSRNLFYWENMAILKDVLIKAGFDVQIGVFDLSVFDAQEINLPSSKSITVHQLMRDDNKLYVEEFVPDIILLNNDLSEGIPDILKNLQQSIIPPAELGWSQRLKSEHFQYYADVSQEFAKQFDIDPWLIAPLFKHCGNIDFMQQDGMHCVINHAENLFAELRQKYDEYNITHPPFLIIKADAGTYGMAVMTVRNVEELKSLNRKQRTRMSKIKGGQTVNRVIIQEGVYTFETFGTEKSVAEPVIYLWGDCVVGGFYRIHHDRGNDENLNSPGMQFQPLPFQHPCDQPSDKIACDAFPNRYYAYGVVARLSMLAAAREIRDQVK